jgi:hypothetical protein
MISENITIWVIRFILYNTTAVVQDFVWMMGS